MGAEPGGGGSRKTFAIGTVNRNHFLDESALPVIYLGALPPIWREIFCPREGGSEWSKYLSHTLPDLPGRVTATACDAEQG
jgi:hypothetical protein